MNFWDFLYEKVLPILASIALTMGIILVIVMIWRMIA